MISARRVSRRGEPLIRSAFARWFYRVINRTSEIYLADGARDFRLVSRKVLDAVVSMPEQSRFSKGLFTWTGFKTKWLEYKNIQRVEGETKWSFGNLLIYSINAIIYYSPKVFDYLNILSVVVFVLS